MAATTTTLLKLFFPLCGRENGDEEEEEEKRVSVKLSGSLNEPTQQYLFRRPEGGENRGTRVDNAIYTHKKTKKKKSARMNRIERRRFHQPRIRRRL